MNFGEDRAADISDRRVRDYLPQAVLATVIERAMLLPEATVLDLEDDHINCDETLRSCSGADGFGGSHRTGLHRSISSGPDGGQSEYVTRSRRYCSAMGSSRWRKAQNNEGYEKVPRK